MQGYDTFKIQYLISGIQGGFRLHFKGQCPKSTSRNHKSALEMKEYVNKKIQMELELGRIAGPFNSPPFDPMVCSPIGLIPKKEEGQFRMIHDLSFPKGASVNDFVPREFATVKFESFDVFVDLLLELPQGALMAKADIQAAFRILPVHPDDYRLLGFTWDGSIFYDRRLPMGASSSCATFECLSNAVQWILKSFNVHWVTHIIDDFMFLGPPESGVCLSYLKFFITLAGALGIPINNKKTVLPSTVIVVHGIEVNSISRTAYLPADKLEEAQSRINALLRKRKATAREIRSTIGFLNFACKVIKPGRAFLRRLIALIIGVKNLNYYIRITSEAKKDLSTWLTFLKEFNGHSLLYKEMWRSSTKLRLYTDAATTKGFGAVFQEKWAYGTWSEQEHYPINMLELYPVVLTLYLWGHLLQNSCVLFYSDNMAVVEILNKQSCKQDSMMILVRQFVLLCLKFNIRFSLKHIPGIHNDVADLLSRFQVSRAREVCPTLEAEPTHVPHHWQLSQLLQES